MPENTQPQPPALPAVVVPPPPAPLAKVPTYDMSQMNPDQRAEINYLLAKVEVYRGLHGLAKTLAEIGGLPRTKKGTMSVGDAYVAMCAGIAVGIDPMRAVGSMVSFNGRASIYGDLALALIRQRGLIKPPKGSWKEEEIGEDGKDSFGFKITAKRTDTGETMSRSFTVGEAKNADLWGGAIWRVWGKKRMLRYRAIGFLVRDLFSDVLMGLHLREELAGGPDDPERAGDAEPEVTMASDAPAATEAHDPMWAGQGNVVTGATVPPAPPVPDPAPPEASPAPEPAPTAPPEPAPTAPEAAQAAPNAPTAAADTPEPATEAPAAPEPDPPPAATGPGAIAVGARLDNGKYVLEVDAQGRPTVIGAEPPKACTCESPDVAKVDCPQHGVVKGQVSLEDRFEALSAVAKGDDDDKAKFAKAEADRKAATAQNEAERAAKKAATKPSGDADVDAVKAAVEKAKARLAAKGKKAKPAADGEFTE